MTNCKYCGDNLDNIKPRRDRQICDKETCRLARKRDQQKTYRAIHPQNISKRQKDYRGKQKSLIKIYNRTYYAIHGPHNRCQWCGARKSFFRNIRKIKHHDLWLCDFCAEVWSIESRKENRKKPARKKQARSYYKKWYRKNRKKLKCAIPGCRKWKGLKRIKEGVYLCPYHRIETKDTRLCERKEKEKGRQLAAFLQKVRVAEAKEDEPVCDNCGRTIPANTPYSRDKQSGSLLKLCKGCRKIFRTVRRKIIAAGR